MNARWTTPRRACGTTAAAAAPPHARTARTARRSITLELRALAAELGTAKQPAGRIAGHGRWSREGWSLDATLAALQPDRLSTRAPAMRLDGPLTLAGSPPAAAQRIGRRAPNWRAWCATAAPTAR